VDVSGRAVEIIFYFPGEPIAPFEQAEKGSKGDSPSGLVKALALLRNIRRNAGRTNLYLIFVKEAQVRRAS